MNQVIESFTPQDHQALVEAYEALEHPSLAARVSNFLGIPLTASLDLLPHAWSASLATASEAAVKRALDVALASLGNKTPMMGSHSSNHRLHSMVTGAVGGFFGLPALLVELPLTTIIILRSIADVARSEGEDLTETEARLACVHVPKGNKPFVRFARDRQCREGAKTCEGRKTCTQKMSSRHLECGLLFCHAGSPLLVDPSSQIGCLSLKARFLPCLTAGQVPSYLGPWLTPRWSRLSAGLREQHVGK